MSLPWFFPEKCLVGFGSLDLAIPEAWERFFLLSIVQAHQYIDFRGSISQFAGVWHGAQKFAVQNGLHLCRCSALGTLIDKDNFTNLFNAGLDPGKRRIKEFRDGASMTETLCCLRRYYGRCCSYPFSSYT